MRRESDETKPTGACWDSQRTKYLKEEKTKRKRKARHDQRNLRRRTNENPRSGNEVNKLGKDRLFPGDTGALEERVHGQKRSRTSAPELRKKKALLKMTVRSFGPITFQAGRKP